MKHLYSSKFLVLFKKTILLLLFCSLSIIKSYSAASLVIHPTCNNQSTGAFDIDVTGVFVNDVKYILTNITTSSIVQQTDFIASKTHSFLDVPAGSYRIDIIDEVEGSSFTFLNKVITSNPVLSGGTIGTNHAVCFGGDPNLLTSTIDPFGGAGTFSYAWEYSDDDGATWKPTLGNGLTYNPSGPLNVTTRYRRKAWNDCPAVYSNEVIVSIGTAPVAGGDINVGAGNETTVCYNTNPPSFTSITPASGGTSCTYIWQITTNMTDAPGGNSWVDIIGTTNSLSLNFNAPLTTNTRFVRKYFNGCGAVYSDVIRVNVNSQITATVTSTNIPCSGSGNIGEINISASGGSGSFQYTIDGGTNWSNNPSFTGLASGTRNVQVRDRLNQTCRIVVNSALVISRPSALSGGSISVLRGPTCSDSPDGRLRANPSGGTAPYSYQWQLRNGSGTFDNIPGETNRDFISALAGNGYRCVVIDANNCGQAFATITFTRAGLASLQDSIPFPISFGTPNSTKACAGQNNGSLSISVSSGGVTPYNYSIINGGASGYQASNSFSNLSSGTYQQWVQDRRTCRKQGADIIVGEEPNQPVSVSITQNPAGAFCSGTNAVFTATSVNEGTSPVYQWRLNNVNVGTNSSTYSNSSLSNNDKVEVILTSSLRCKSGDPATSNAITVTVNTAPSISDDPDNSAICSGGNTTFSVTASGTGLTYQWQRLQGGTWTDVTDLAPYSGSNGSVLTITGASASMNNNRYRCIVSGTCNPSATSDVATLIVNTAPSISLGPQDRTICAGTNTTFNVTANGAGLTYQWQVLEGGIWKDINNDLVYNGVTTSALNITGATTSMNGYQYHCVVSGTCNPQTTSNTATLAVNSAPSISADPQDKIICSGDNTSFSVTANGVGLSYKWQVYQNGSWSDINNGVLYNGVATSTLNITSATASMNGLQYRCIVSGTCNPAATSAAADLTVNTAPAISAGPIDQTVCSGDNASFRTTATGTGLSYKWEVYHSGAWGDISNGALYNGVTTPTLNITGATATMNDYQYRCIVSGSCNPSATSAAAVLRVNTAPAITAHPENRTICSGNNTSFSVTASGTGITYQWQIFQSGSWSNVNNDLIYGGATTSTLNITGATASMNSNRYRCVVSGCPPSVTSNDATLTVNTAPSISTGPSNQTVCSGSNATFSVTASGTNLTYQWETLQGGIWVPLNNDLIYGGVTTSTLVVTGASVSLNNNRYRCVVSGACNPLVTSAAATLTVNTAPAVVTDPVDQIICSGSNAIFNVAATGTNLTYKWQIFASGLWTDINNGAQYSGTTSSALTVLSATALMNGFEYRCVVSGTCTPSATSASASLTVNTAPSISDDPDNSAICSGGNTTFSVTASGTGLTYQWQRLQGGTWTDVTDLAPYSGSNGSVLTITGATASMNNNQYRCIVSGTCNPSASSGVATLTVNTAPSISLGPQDRTICSGTNTTFNVTANGAGLSYQWQVLEGGIWKDINNDLVYNGVTTSALNITGAITLMNGYQYHCVVSGTCNPPTTSNSATLTVNSAPSISLGPEDKIICSGDNTSFSVTANGAGLSYKWQVYQNGSWSDINNGVVYNGVASSVLNITNASASMNGLQYRCIVSGTCNPAATSAAANLTVNTAPAISAGPIDQTVCSGDNASFSITATGTGLSYKWEVYHSGAWGDISNGALYNGVTTPTLNITGATATMNDYQYRCIVSGSCNPSATSTVAVLRVNTAPAITAHPENRTICSGNNTSFSVTASGTGITYQWQIFQSGSWSNVNNDLIYGGATTSTLNITGATASMNSNRYRCVVSGCPPSVTSNEATLTVNTAPSISTGPSNQTVCSGSNATFSVTASGTNLTYQWEALQGGIWVPLNNDLIYGGVSTSTLVVTGASVSLNNNRYRCVVSGACNPLVTSAAATLTVNTAPAVVTDPVDQIICSGSNAIFNVAATGTNLTYKWQIFESGLWTDINNGAQYSGTTSSALTVLSATASMNGFEYRCVVSGTCTPSATSASASLTVNTAPSISDDPDNSTICSGSNTTFSVTASGTGLTYQWQRLQGGTWTDVTDIAPYSGSNSSVLTITGATASMNNYQYRCIVSGTCNPSATSSAATLTVNTAPVVSIEPTNATVCEDQDIIISLTATGSGLTYQWQFDTGSGWNDIPEGGVYSGTQSSALQISNSSLGMNGYQYRCIVSGSCPPAVNSQSIVLTVNEKPRITAQPTDINVCENSNTDFTIIATGTGLSYQWQQNSGSGWVSISDNTLYSGTNTPTLSITGASLSMNSYTYRCIVSGTCSPDAISTGAILTVDRATAITTQPLGVRLCLGESAEFTVQAVGTGMITYSWQKLVSGVWVNLFDDSKISGSNSNVLMVTNISEADETSYRCVVHSDCGTDVTSNEVVLDANVITATIGKPRPFLISNTTTITVGIKVRGHNHIDDLSYYLVAPDGVRVPLKRATFANAAWCNYNQDVNLTFTTQKPITDSIPSVCDLDATPGVYAASGNWSLLYGKDPSNGAWKVEVEDILTDGFNSGKLTEANITFTDLNADGAPESVNYNSGVIDEDIIDPVDDGCMSSGCGTIAARTSYIIPLGLSTSCSNTCDAKAIVNVSGGVEPYTYRWHDNGSTSRTRDLCPGTYVVTVTDALGCEDDATVIVTAPAPITIDNLAYTENLACSTEKTNLTITAQGGTAPLSYSIDGGTTFVATATFNDLGRGTYNIVVRDVNGCRAERTITINQPDALSVESVNKTDVTCNGLNNGTINIYVNGGVAPYEFVLSDGTITTTNDSGAFDDLAPGSYTITVTDANGCSVPSLPASIEITQPEALSIAPVVTNISCHDANDGSIVITVTGGTGPYQYSLNGGELQSDNSFTGLSGEEYAIAVEDAAGCTITQTVEVINPSVIRIDAVTYSNATNSTLGCNGDRTGITITASGGTGVLNYTYEGITDVNPVGTEFSSLGAGTYNFHISDENGCVKDTTIIIIEPSPFILESVNISNIRCFGQNNGQIDVFVSGGTAPYTYVLSGGSTNNTGHYENLAPGSYTITITDANNCGAPIVTTVEVREPVELSIGSVETSNITCNGANNASITITATGGTEPYTYSFDGGNTYQNAATFTGLSAAIYNVVVRDANGCMIPYPAITFVEPVAITINDADVHITDVLTCNGNPEGAIDITAYGGTGALQYSLNGTDFQPNGIFSNLIGGDYIVTVRDANLCTVTKSIQVKQPAPIVVTITHTNVSASAKGTIHVSATGGTDPINYSINGTDYQPSGDFVNLEPGLYHVYVKDSKGCIVENVVNISNLSVDIQKQDVKCFGELTGYIHLIVPAELTGIKYSIDGGTTSQDNGTFDNLGMGIYNVKVWDESGATFESSVAIGSGPEIQASVIISDITSCAGANTGVLVIQASGGAGSLRYSIDNGSSYQSENLFNTLVAGSYSVKVIDESGCVISRNAVVAEPAPLTISTSTTQVRGKIKGTVHITATGGSGELQYSIDGINYQASADFSNLDANTYTAYVKDANGCSNSTPFEITQSASGVEVLVDHACHGDNGTIAVTLTCVDCVTGTQYSINDGATFQNEPIFPNLKVGTYPLVVRFASLPDYKEDVVVGHPYVSATIVKASCRQMKADGVADGSIGLRLHYAQSATYLWSNGSTEALNDTLMSGKYIVSLVTDKNCALKDTFFVESIDTSSVYARKDTSICPGKSVELTSTNNIIDPTELVGYIWQKGDSAFMSVNQSVFVTPDTASFYTVYMSYKGCISKDTVKVGLHPVLGLYAGSDTIVGEGQLLQLDAKHLGEEGFARYKWIPSDYLDSDTIKSPVITPISALQDIFPYTVIGTTKEGCIETDTLFITIAGIIKPYSGLTPNNDGKNDVWVIDNIGAYPGVQVSVFNRWGEKVFFTKNYDNETNAFDGTRNGRPLPEGTYYYIIESTDGTSRRSGPITIVR